MKMKIFKNSSKTFVAIIICLSIIITAGATDSLSPLGHTTGIQISSDGAMIVGFSDESSDSPARRAGLTAGDIITKISAKCKAHAILFLKKAFTFLTDRTSIYAMFATRNSLVYYIPLDETTFLCYSYNKKDKLEEV